MNTKILLSFAGALLAVSSFAGDVSTTEFLGFSPDGRAVGFQQYGNQDGSGFPYCTVVLIDTEKNTYLVPPASLVIQAESDLPPRKVCNKAKSKIRDALNKLRLNPALGTRTFSRLITDEAGQGAKIVNYGTFASVPAQRPNTVSVIETETTAENEFGLKTPLLKVVLKTQQGERVLQEDKKLPRARKSVYAYELEEGYSYETEKISVQVFTIRTYTQGFEGPDVRTMVVTGTLNFN